MEPRRILAAIACLCLLAPTGAARAAGDNERTRTYVAPPGGVYVDNLNDQVGIGGYIFPADGKIPKKITITDAGQELSTDAIAFRVCQDLDKDKNCQNDEEFKGCSTGSSITIPKTVPWSPQVATAIFIRPGDRSCDGTSPALTGTITFTTTAP